MMVNGMERKEWAEFVQAQTETYGKVISGSCDRISSLVDSEEVDDALDDILMALAFVSANVDALCRDIKLNELFKEMNRR